MVSVVKNQKTKKRRKHYSARTIVFLVFKYVFYTVVGLVFVLPAWWMVVNSFKTHAVINSDITSIRTFLPSFGSGSWVTSYKNLFKAFPYFSRALLNSFLYAGIQISLVLLINSFAGYALARFRFPGSKMYVTIIILILIVPVETSVVPLYVLLHKLGLLNTHTAFGTNLRVVAYILPGIASPFYIYMFRQFFFGIPKDLEDAARIDGAGRLRIYFRIIIPLSTAVFGTVTIFAFMGVWNDYLFPQLLFNVDQKLFPLQVFLEKVNQYNPKDMSMLLASLTVSTIPIALVYIFFQKYIVEGVAFTGLK